ncbi:MAG: hypothetical protein A3J93_01015 [Candidatus Magasanikbacteria bacterium RIFOXYC2_FULL_42_28]|uniref:Glycosyl transferase family 1 domain-containing protein n=1 Tax=Candidatus Magasanikbacteria bacterium RIFOXYC2_FULL_42_28 TaxID=1798704 RepID=A0A1F6NXK9_9BACT|nr:MAG: hypothetical protein A3J93_01015 [Candidatus Magasanikbacteria bacterium RIFOXYC2_FULL_42_28]
MNLYLDNIIFYLQNFGGISAYWDQIAVNFISRSDVNIKFIEPLHLGAKFKERSLIQRGLIIDDRKLPLSLVRYFPINKINVLDNSIFHSSYFRYSTNKKVKNVITVYDFTYEYYMRGLAKRVHHWQKSLAIRKAAGIICISENTKKDLLHFYPDLDEKNIKVIYLSADKSFKKIENLDIATTRFKDLNGKKVVSFVGKRTEYKNFKMATEVIKKLPADYHLLIVGGGDITNKEKATLASFERRYTHMPDVNSEELNIVYNLSFCYLYPSEYEGFGIPILEAMQAGCPVICQNVSSIPEVYGEVGNIVNGFNDVEEFCANIIKLESTDFRMGIIKRGTDNASRFNWNKTGKETFDFYNFLSGNIL